MNKVQHRGKIYTIYFDVTKTQSGLSFFTVDQDFIQVGIWNYKANKLLPAHYHNEFERLSTRTCESIFVVKGEVLCNIYTKSGKKLSSFKLKKNQMAVQIYGVHEYKILKDSLVIENKNGPYYGPEIDRKRINVKKN